MLQYFCILISQEIMFIIEWTIMIYFKTGGPYIHYLCSSIIYIRLINNGHFLGFWILMLELKILTILNINQIKYL